MKPYRGNGNSPRSSPSTIYDERINLHLATKAGKANTAMRLRLLSSDSLHKSNSVSKHQYANLSRGSAANSRVEATLVTSYWSSSSSSCTRLALCKVLEI